MPSNLRTLYSRMPTGQRCCRGQGPEQRGGGRVVQCQTNERCVAIEVAVAVEQGDGGLDMTVAWVGHSSSFTPIELCLTNPFCLRALRLTSVYRWCLQWPTTMAAFLVRQTDSYFTMARASPGWFFVWSFPETFDWSFTACRKERRTPKQPPSIRARRLAQKPIQSFSFSTAHNEIPNTKIGVVWSMF